MRIESLPSPLGLLAALLVLSLLPIPALVQTITLVWLAAIALVFAELGWLGAVIPEEFGGAGFGHLELALIAPQAQVLAGDERADVEHEGA